MVVVVVPSVVVVETGGLSSAECCGVSVDTAVGQSHGCGLALGCEKQNMSMETTNAAQDCSTPVVRSKRSVVSRLPATSESSALASESQPS
jgi:hypothetical protein